ncbi:MAG TPA: nucleotidyltransferase domain-containing protein [Caldisericia bacterium]|nr:nucleotidyltransferase domain-containing protein [Caldisericia bacterium]HXK52021.1 nucleotidyltransferase domain-containing protein [Caldisericia bacterium]
MKKQDTAPIEKTIVEICLASYPNLHAIYLFGSFGTPYEREDSDIDIAILFHHSFKTDTSRFVNLISDLSHTLHKTVDLVSLRDAGTILQKEIVYKGKRIYCDNGFKVDEYEVFIMRRYQLFLEERKEIVQDGLEKGRFYGQ